MQKVWIKLNINKSSIKIYLFYSFGGVQQASKIAGQRRKPSQSPSMRLLGMLHVNDDQDGNTYLSNILNGNENNLYWFIEPITKGWKSENVSRMIFFCFYLSQKASDLQNSCAYPP